MVQGERNEQFESFHFFESRLDVSPSGVVVFSSKYLERDALFFWSLKQGKVVGRYEFRQLVSILSPAWAPDGKSVVYVRQGEAFVPREVEIGAVNTTQVAVTSGIQPGEEVALQPRP